MSRETRTRVLVVHDQLPHFDRSGADMRLMQVLRSLLRNRCDVTFVARNGLNRATYERPLEELGIKVYGDDSRNLRYAGAIVPVTWDLAEILRDTHFDIAVLCLWFGGKIAVPEQYLDEIRRYSPSTRILVLTDDRHGLRERRLSELTRSFADEERANDFQQREIEILLQADLVTAISQEDRRGLLALDPELRIELLPMAAAEHNSGPIPGLGSRRDLLFVGNFDNPANREGFDWFLREVWPQLRPKLSGAQVSVVGVNALQDWFGKEGVVLRGQIPDLNPVLHQHRIFISPIRYGTGIKTKNILALSHGLPLVTTSVGAEGIELHSGQHALVADVPADFAQCVARLYQDKDLWTQLSENGRAHVMREFSSEKQDTQVAALLGLSQQIQPKPFEPSHCFSIRAVEKSYPDVLASMPPWERLYERMVKQLELATLLLEKAEPEAALEQLRHVFALYPASVPGGSFFFEAFDQMAKCYRALGNQDQAARCAREARRCGRGQSKKTHASSATTSERKTLALSIITRNAAQVLLICLESVRGVVNEIVVADTGSTDETCEIARRFGAQVIAIPWGKDFSAARNACLAAVKSDWILVLDSDEELDPQAAQIIPQLLKQPGFLGYRVPLRHYVWSIEQRGWDQRARRNDSTLERTKRFPAYVQQEIIRLFRRDPGIFFEGRVHEMVDRSILRRGGKIGDATFCIHHYGHVAAPASVAEKTSLYRELGRLKVQDMPNDAHSHLELGLQEMDNFCNYEEALKCFDRACELDPANYSAWLFAGMAATRLGRYAEALQRLQRVPKNSRCAALLAETQGEAFFNLGDFEAATHHYRRALQACPGDPVLESKTGMCELRIGRTESGLQKLHHAVQNAPSNHELLDRLVAAYVSLGKLPEAAEWAERRIEQAGNTPEAFLRAASIRAQLKDWPRVSSLLQNGIEKFPAAEKLKTALDEVTAVSA